MEAQPDDDSSSEVELLTSEQVGAIFGVDPRSVTRWANIGRLPFTTVLGGEHRYRVEDVRRLLDREN
jgi:predicted site-specific integrase-resolvase